MGRKIAALVRVEAAPKVESRADDGLGAPDPLYGKYDPAGVGHRQQTLAAAQEGRARYPGLCDLSGRDQAG